MQTAFQVAIIVNNALVGKELPYKVVIRFPHAIIGNASERLCFFLVVWPLCCFQKVRKQLCCYPCMFPTCLEVDVVLQYGPVRR